MHMDSPAEAAADDAAAALLAATLAAVAATVLLCSRCRLVSTARRSAHAAAKSKFTYVRTSVVLTSTRA